MRVYHLDNDALCDSNFFRLRMASAADPNVPAEFAKAWRDGKYRLVATLPDYPDLTTEQALERAFELTNHIDRSWTENHEVAPVPGAHRSTSTGDMVVRDGQGFACSSFGWMRVPTM